MSSPYQPQPYVRIAHPEWSKSATIYQINTRQFTDAGTFAAAQAHLPRLKALGVDIVWLMPIHPIGEKNRKGSLGSPYAVRDYYGVNPEFGTLDDLRRFVDAAHELGMYVILDWVANHTAWDNPLAEQHPEWYARDWKGDLRPTPWWDWPDIIDLDYEQPGLRQYMAAAMKYWVAEVGVDGYRCDVAGFVPLDFWEQARRDLDAIKPVFMLAEWESRDLHAAAFDMTYGWSWYDAVHTICMGRGDVSLLNVYYAWNERFYPPGCMRMTFVSNHDKNSWEGTEFEQFGDGIEAAIVLSVVGEGMPLVYNGQEAGNTRRLEFFERDPLVWSDHSHDGLYTRLFELKKANKALWNAQWGARMVQVVNDAPLEVFSFVRQNERDKVFVAINFSARPQRVGFQGELHHGSYRDFFSGETVTLAAGDGLDLPPWGYKVFTR